MIKFDQLCNITIAYFPLVSFYYTPPILSAQPIHHIFLYIEYMKTLP